MKTDASNADFPSYTYVPGQTPHPISHPDGHLYGTESSLHELGETTAINWGIQLFNRGYYWEAHEVWEQVWMNRGRTGPAADLMKGLIKLAAAGVKCLETNAQGAVRHGTRALELFTNLNHEDFGPYFEKKQLIDLSEALIENPPVLPAPSKGTPSPLPGLKISTFPVDQTDV